jgi:hypothetical protein
MLFAPAGAGSLAVQGYPAYGQPLPYRPLLPLASTPPSGWSPAANGPVTESRPTIRAQMGEEAPPRAAVSSPVPVRRVALTMPAPDELGIPAPQPAASPTIDWAGVHAQLDHLEVRCFHLEKRAEGGYRITCLLAAAEPGRSHRIEAIGASEPEAIHLALAQAEAWSKGR